LKDWKTIPTFARSWASCLPSAGSGSPVDGDRAGVDGLEPVDRPAQRALAGAGRPDDHDDLAAVDRQVDLLEDVQRAEVLVDAREDDERVDNRRS
jgi:hypothetical protein